MFDIGFLELVMIAVVALLVLGPERLPGAARSAGRWIGTARRMVSQVTQEVDRQIKLEELREKLAKEANKIGVADVQQSVKSALDEAKQFEHLVNRDVTGSTTPATTNATTDTPTAPPLDPQPQPAATNTERNAS